jgi:hypothetical protein
MATVSYTYVDRCQGGGHFRVDVSLNSGPPHRFVYTTDEIREPLSALDDDQRQIASLAIIKLHMAGKTRQQMIDEFTLGPIEVTL